VKLLYDWLILPPAVLIDYALLCLFGLAALVPPLLAWHCTVRFIETGQLKLTFQAYPARPRRLISWVAAIVVSTYVLLICLTAVHELPRVFYRITDSEDSN
jgi:hypothetical protein